MNTVTENSIFIISGTIRQAEHHCQEYQLEKGEHFGVQEKKKAMDGYRAKEKGGRYPAL